MRSGWEVSHRVRVRINRAHGQGGSRPQFIPSEAEGERLLISSQVKGCQPWLRPPHSTAWTCFSSITILLYAYVRESKVRACCSKRWQNSQWSIISRESDGYTISVSLPTNPPLPSTGPKTSTTCVPSAKHISHPKIRFLDA